MWWPAPNDDKAFGVVRTAMNRHNAEMARLRFSAITSADGYVNDADGSFDWAVPSDELHAVVNDHQREIGTLLLGRRMYERAVRARWLRPRACPGHRLAAGRGRRPGRGWG